jgi:glucose-6-phosphate 1-dehydrogenase
LLFQAKIPGPRLQLQNVDMGFKYGAAFKASRYTGYEVMIYSCTHGDATLFSRSDLVEAAWRIAQPILNYWQATPADNFPNYSRHSWGPKSANELVERDGRRWFEVVTPDVLEQSPLFEGAEPMLLSAVIMALRSRAVAAGETIIQLGELTHDMYIICRGEVAVLDAAGSCIKTLKDGDFFGEIALLQSVPRTATIKAVSLCNLFVLGKIEFSRILRDHPQFAEAIMAVAKQRYNLAVTADQLMTSASH